MSFIDIRTKCIDLYKKKYNNANALAVPYDTL